MRSYPTCWNRTLTKLGLKRKVTTRGATVPSGRGQFEKLEPRQLLTASSWVESVVNDDSMGPVVIGSSTSSGTATPDSRSQEFKIVGGASKDLFTVTTQLDDNQQPLAVLSLNELAKASGELQHEIILELRQGNFGVSKHHVIVTLASDEFLAVYRQDRLANAQSKSVDAPAEEALSLLLKLTESGEFSDLENIEASPSGGDANLAIEATRLDEITKAISKNEITLDASEQKQLLYSSLNLVADKLEASEARAEIKAMEFAQKTRHLESLEGVELEDAIHELVIQGVFNNRNNSNSLTSDERKEIREQFGKIAIQIADQIQFDLKSTDQELVASAQQARDTLVANASFTDLLWKGYGVNSAVAKHNAKDSVDVQYSAFYEAGQLQLSDSIAIHVGSPAYIEMTESPLNGGFSAGGLAASMGVSAGPASNVVAEADTYVGDNFNGDDGTSSTVSSGLYQIEIADGGPGGQSLFIDYNFEALMRFDVSGFSQYPTSATVELTPIAVFSGIVGDTDAQQSAEIVANDWEESTVSWETRPDANPSSPVLTSSGDSVWTVTDGDLTTVELDVSSYVRQKLRQGDLNFDGIKAGTVSEVIADVAAFEMAVKDPAAYEVTYGYYESDATDSLDRADVNRDGMIDANDAKDFLATHGYLQGDYDFSGNSAGFSFLQFQQMLNQTASYFEGDVDFSGIIDGGDLDIWVDEFSLTPPAPADEKLSLKLFAPTSNPIDYGSVQYGTRENPNSNSRPDLHVDQEPDLILGKFNASSDANLQVTYNILNEALTSFDVEIYRSSDGVTPDVGGLLMTHTVTDTAALQPGLIQEIAFQADFATLNNDVLKDYYLVAKLVANSSVGQLETAVVEFEGGGFQENDRTVHIHGTDLSDNINVLDSYAPTIEFEESSLQFYQGNGVETPNNIEVLHGGNTLRLWGNIWRAIDFNYQITPHTILEFDFSSSVEGEIHAIGFDTNLSANPQNAFKVHGSQPWGIQDYDNYDPADGTTHYRIPVGEHYTGSHDYLFFASDDDADVIGESVFSNVRVYEGSKETYVRAHSGNDVVRGDGLSKSPTYIFGADGDDWLRGGGGWNQLLGQEGDDTVVVPPRHEELGQLAFQVLYESGGDDTYVFEAGPKGYSIILAEGPGMASGNDTLDFSQLGQGITTFDLNNVNNPNINANLGLNITDDTDTNGAANIENHCCPVRSRIVVTV